MPGPQLFVGVMSGTSLDGADAVLVAIGADGVPLLQGSAYRPYPDELRGELLALHEPRSGEIHAAALAANSLARIYGDVIADLLAASGLAPSAIRAVGCHGQTIRHRPEAGYTLQIGNAALLAELTGLTVVTDFRSRDIAAGGQGAPLVPACHEALFRHPARHRLIVNIGGMANVTDLDPQRATLGFDCGPGNVLLDAWVRRHRNAGYDAGGAWAATGAVLPALLARLAAHPYFALPPPKSCGREQFEAAWLERALAGGERPADVARTLVALTAASIADAVRRWCGMPDEVYVCGGGAHNATLMAQLAADLPQAALATTAALGMPPQRVEAAAFAWLAQRARAGLPGNLPAGTGAAGRRVLGAIYPA